MRVLGVIPARWSSTRFPGKILTDIAGKPMLQHVWERAKACQNIDEVWIACDNENVLKASRSFGAQVIMTDPNHPSGSDRIAEAVQDKEVDIIINLQGDEPLLHVPTVEALVEVMLADRSCAMATVIKKISDSKMIADPNVVKVVCDKDGFALYFSRAPIPFNRDGKVTDALKHIGLYAYTKDFLLKYTQLPKSYLETTEKLEQLRVLEAGYKIKTCLTEYESIGVDIPEDVNKVLEAMNQK